MNRLLELAMRDLSEARDNLYRARMTAKHFDQNTQYGESGKTLAEIIAGYEAWEREALDTVEKLKEHSCIGTPPF